MPFVPSVMGEDMDGATDDGGGGEKMFKEYCKRVEQSGDWGGELEVSAHTSSPLGTRKPKLDHEFTQIEALCKNYKIPIHIIQRGPPYIIAHSPGEEGGNGAITSKESLHTPKAVRISYHRRMYGLGEHYNSLRPIPRDEPNDVVHV